jgi:hypothetical protein
MDTLMIELTNHKAYKLLQDMEDLNLIRVLKKKSDGISSLRQKIRTRMSEEQIQQQLDSIRKEWQRNT